MSNSQLGFSSANGESLWDESRIINVTLFERVFIQQINVPNTVFHTGNVQ